MNADELALQQISVPSLPGLVWRSVEGLSRDIVVSVGFGTDGQGRSVVQALVVQSSTRVSSDQLQRVPLSQIERVMNRPATADELECLENNFHPLVRVPGDDLHEFATEVARQYVIYAGLSRAPARAIAARSNVPVKRVHRWIREARLLGKLPPGRRGLVG